MLRTQCLFDTFSTDAVAVAAAAAATQMGSYACIYEFTPENIAKRAHTHTHKR